MVTNNGIDRTVAAEDVVNQDLGNREGPLVLDGEDLYVAGEGTLNDEDVLVVAASWGKRSSCEIDVNCVGAG